MNKWLRAAIWVLAFLAPVSSALADAPEDSESVGFVVVDSEYAGFMVADSEYAGFVVALRIEEGAFLKMPASLEFSVRQNAGGTFRIQLTEKGIREVQDARKKGQTYQTRVFRGSKATLRNTATDKDDCYSFQTTVIPLAYLDDSIRFGIDRRWLDADDKLARRQPYVIALESHQTRPQVAGEDRLENFRIKKADFQQYLANSIEIYAAPAPDGRFDPKALKQIQQWSKPVALSLTGVRCFVIKSNPPRVLAVSPGLEVYGLAYAAECS